MRMETDGFQKVFGQRLRSCRKAAGYRSADDLSKLLGVTPLTFRRYERGEFQPRLDILAALARLLNTSIDYLVTGDRSASKDVRLPLRRHARTEDATGPHPFAQSLRMCRTACGLTVPGLAQATGISLEDLERYEDGSLEPYAHALYLISTALGVSVSELLHHYPAPSKAACSDKELQDFVAVLQRLPAKERGMIATMVKSLGNGKA